MAERARSVLREANFDPATLSDGFGPKVEAAKILERHFSSSGQYVYDLDLSLLRIRENEDPIEAFLRVNKALEFLPRLWWRCANRLGSKPEWSWAGWSEMSHPVDLE